MSQGRFIVAGLLLIAFLGGIAVAQLLLADDDDSPVASTPVVEPQATASADPPTVDPTATSVPPTPSAEPVPTDPPAEPATPTGAPMPTAEPTPTVEPTAAIPIPEVVVLGGPPPTYDAAIALATSLAPGMVIPSQCGLPLDVPASLPNSPRDYRSGIHQGIDFICRQLGRDAVAALPGRVVTVVGDYVDPTPADRSAALGVAADLGRTPPWTLAMLYGNFVVIDHGVVDGVGHVVTVSAHLDSVDPAVRPGVELAAGQRIGEIGNKGTDAASTGADNPPSLHLHWELHIDDVYLGAGLDTAQTREVYRILFSGA